jgi:hypothetical protein
MTPQDQYTSYVNKEMELVNELTDELYESMMDRDNEEVVRTVNKLKFRILEIQRSYRNETSL